MKPTSITRRFASTQKYFPLTNHLEQLLSLQGALKSILTRAVGSLSCFFAFCKLSENVAEMNNMTTSVSFRWKLERNQKKCFGEKRRQCEKKKKRRKKIKGNIWVRRRGSVCEWDQLPLLVQLLPQVTARRQILNNICYRFFSLCQTQALLELVLLTSSPLFRMRVFMWHLSDGRRKDTKNKFDWRSRVWKVRRKSFLQAIGWEARCEIGSFWKWRSVAGTWGMPATDKW